MLIDALAKEKELIREEGRQQGIEQGIEQGKIALRNTIELILQRRFGPVPAAVKALLGQCNLAELNELVNPALDAADLAAFLTDVPRQAR